MEGLENCFLLCSLNTSAAQRCSCGWSPLGGRNDKIDSKAMKLGHEFPQVQMFESFQKCVQGNIICIRCAMIVVTPFIDKALESYLRSLSVSALM